MDAPPRVEVFAGRAAERARLGDAVAAAADRRPAAVLVRGEAGVGKTRLVEDACRRASDAGFAVLWGRCLRFGEVALPCLPLVGAFEDWLAGADAADREAVLQAAPGLASLLPSLGSARAAVPDEALLPTIDRALNLIAGSRPAVLVVDDVQWADATSLDVLSYLVAGLRAQRLLVLVTLRDDELGEGELLHGWLADLVRLPAVGELRLGRMTTAETGEQLRLLLGREPDPELVGGVVARTGGNPYFTELVAAAIDPQDQRLPTQLPGALASALSATWHRMSAEARETTRMLAVAGRPTSQPVLARACGGDVGAALREAVEAGVVRPGGDRVWFRHPLLAEVLMESLLPEERRSRHRALAVVLAEAPGADARDLATLAVHYEAAGMADEAFEACLVAADAAAAVGAFTEESAQRVRAARIYPRVRPEVRDRHGSEASLCRLAAFQARRAGDETGAFALLQRACVVLDLEPDPVQRGMVLLLYAQIGRDLGALPELLPVLEEARELCAGSDAEHSLVLAEIAFEEVRTGRPGAGRHVEEAVGLAERSGDPRALSYALGVRASVLVGTPEGERAARRGYEVAQAQGSPEWTGIALIMLTDALEHSGRWVECADLLLSGFRAPAVEAIAGMSQLVGAYAARFLCEVGRLDEAAEVLRRVLSSRAVGLPGNQARQSAIRLCLRQGRMEEADGHLQRLRELMPGFVAMGGGFYGADVLAEHLLAHDRPAEALAVVADGIADQAVADSWYGDTLLVWAARATGELAVGGDSEAARHGLRRVVHRREEAAGPAFADAAVNPVTASLRASFLAEEARCESSQGSPESWRHAVEQAKSAGLLHEQCRTTLALARCLLSSRSGRAEGVDRLREAEALARRMGAAPLVDQAGALARLARVPLADPGVGAPAGGDGLLTPRELEVLAHLVAGRTYAEIARELVISEKTVSVHVSNLLRKTGAANRVEVAVWAERHGMAATPPG